ncbi:MAG: primosomal protein N' [Anaerolineae bacterium]|nr:primosomal protein N' [Anaerolineae bacterium]
MPFQRNLSAGLAVFAEIVVLSTVGSSSPTFTYSLPAHLQEVTVPGSLVIVPFGPRRLYGIVLTLSEISPVIETRPVEALVDPQPVLTAAQLALARWMSEEYLSPLWRCLAIMLPPGIVGYADVQVELGREVGPGDVRTQAEESLVTVLDARGPLRGRQLDRLLPRQQWRRAAAQLARRGVVIKSHLLTPPRARPRQVRTVTLLDDGHVESDRRLEGLRSERYRAIIEFLRAEDGPVDVSWVYAETGCNRYHLDKLAERGLVAFDIEEVWRDPLADELFVPDVPPPLTSDQERVWQVIASAIGKQERAIFLLHGVTGSGKTEIYLRAVAEVIAQGRQAIVLVPEIALTPQMAHRFGARFGRRIAILHSGLSDGERYDTWRRARAGLVDIVIGPRSALFTPFARLGLIVVDEEHDGSYKQEELEFEVDELRERPPSRPALMPPYHARDAALELGRLSGAAVILGSATPSMESYYRARRGEFTLLEMPRRILGHVRRLQDLQARYRLSTDCYRLLPGASQEVRYRPLPTVRIVDLRAELRAGNRSIFSRALQKAVDEALSRGEQAILFYNRRGTATCVLCRDCGYTCRCPNCATPLTYHETDSQLVCHHCDHRESLPERCPTCGSRRIRHLGLGTEQVEQAVHQRWPEVRILRWDRDTARSYAAHAAILDLFSSGLAHILVGTQMIAKGLDLPLVTVVGVISADLTLHLPDFRAAERTFQLLAQVAGRAGRGLLGGEVIIQTYLPDHYAIVAAAAHDYGRFATQELAFRLERGYPPYRRLAKLVYEDVSPARAKAEARELAATLRGELTRRGLPPTDLIGPVPPFLERRYGLYRQQLLLLHPRPADILRSVKLPPGWTVDVDPVSLL